MDSLTDLSRHIATADFGFGRIDRRFSKGNASVIYCNGEREGNRIIPNDKNRPGCRITGRDDAVEVNQRDLPSHGLPKARVITMCRVIPSIAIPEEA
jgi:hypothetical protein